MLADFFPRLAPVLVSNTLGEEEKNAISKFQKNVRNSASNHVISRRTSQSTRRLDVVVFIKTKNVNDYFSMTVTSCGSCTKFPLCIYSSITSDHRIYERIDADRRNRQAMMSSAYFYDTLIQNTVLRGFFFLTTGYELIYL